MKKLPPIKKSLTPVIATTALTIEVNKKTHKIKIELGTPIQDVGTITGMDWRCPFKISGLIKKIGYACGVDSMQALTLALERIKLVLTDLEAKHQSKIIPHLHIKATTIY